MERKKKIGAVDENNNQRNPEISLLALTSSHNPRIMRIMEKIEVQWVTTLVDIG